MKSYTEFAAFYDNLTQNVDYKKLAKYYDGLIKIQQWRKPCA